MKQVPIHELRSHISKRARLAKMLGMREASSVKESGLYVYHYVTFLMVRVYYAQKDGRVQKVYEERCDPKTFPTDETIAKLMLLAR